MTLDELVAWAEARSTDSDWANTTYGSSQKAQYSPATASGLGSLANDRRRYALSLFPALMVSRGQLVSTLVSSDVSKYVGFRLLDGTSIWDGDAAQRVPGSKEDVFRDKSISLPDKRKLMKTLMFAGGDFEDDETVKGTLAAVLKLIADASDSFLPFLESKFGLPPNLANAIAYAVAFAGPDEQALPALERARRYLRSIGRYGPSAFLVGQYGGAGEVAQGFCR